MYFILYLSPLFTDLMLMPAYALTFFFSTKNTYSFSSGLKSTYQNVVTKLKSIYIHESARLKQRVDLYETSTQLKSELGHLEFYDKDGNLLNETYVPGINIQAMSGQTVIKHMLMALENINLENLHHITFIHTHPKQPATIPDIFSQGDIAAFGGIKSALNLLDINVDLHTEIVYQKWGRIKTKSMIYSEDHPEHSALSTQHSVLSTQHSVLSTQYS